MFIVVTEHTNMEAAEHLVYIERMVCIEESSIISSSFGENQRATRMGRKPDHELKIDK